MQGKHSNDGARHRTCMMMQYQARSLELSTRLRGDANMEVIGK